MNCCLAIPSSLENEARFICRSPSQANSPADISFADTACCLTMYIHSSLWLLYFSLYILAVLSVSFRNFFFFSICVQLLKQSEERMEWREVRKAPTLAVLCRLSLPVYNFLGCLSFTCTIFLSFFLSYRSLSYLISNCTSLAVPLYYEF